MLRGRAGIPVLAELAGPPAGPAWALRRQDLTNLTPLLPQLLERRLIAVTGEGEAPAVAALSLAAAASASGHRTVLVDCDLIQPRLASRTGVDATPGLHEYLRWEAEPQDVLQSIALAGPETAAATEPLVCVSGGRPASKAETLLGLRSFAHMVAKLRAAYELTLLLSPSLLLEPGAALAVVSQTEATVAGLSAEQARSRAGRGVRAAVNRLPVPTLGAIAVGGPAS